jgi:hypothetical protein
MRGKTILLSLAAAACGTLLACFLFAMSFNARLRDAAPDLAGLAAVAASASFAAGLLDAAHWRRIVLLLAAPSILLCAIIAAMLLAERRWDPAWLVVAAAGGLLCLGSGWAGKRLARRDA